MLFISRLTLSSYISQQILQFLTSLQSPLRIETYLASVYRTYVHAEQTVDHSQDLGTLQYGIKIVSRYTGIKHSGA